MTALVAEETTPLLGTRIVEVEQHKSGSPANGNGDSNGNVGHLLDNVVDFDPNGDPDNPLEWPSAFKWGIVALLAFTAFTVYAL